MAADFAPDDKIIPIANENDAAADDYLSRLSNSILAKDRISRTSGVVPIPPISASQSQVAIRKIRLDGTPSPEPISAPSAPKAAPAPAPSGWLRRVDYYDNAGKFIVGTILVFEDGSMGVYKEADSARDYDVVLMLQEGGTVHVQGLPLYNYTVEPVGRLTGNCLDNIMQHGRWERDSLIFHLLKFRDRVYIPGEGSAPSQLHSGPAPTLEPQQTRARSSSSTAVPMLHNHATPEAPVASESAHNAPMNDGPLERQLRRGRKLTINFDKTRAWKAVYWGKDMMGFVVVHKTEEGWALMHLDLEKFRKNLIVGDQCTDAELQQMEKDLTSR